MGKERLGTTDPHSSNPVTDRRLIPTPDLAYNFTYRQAFLILALVTLVACIPAMRGGFVFDDPLYVSENEDVRNPQGLFNIWFKPSASAYYPMTLTTFWLEFRFWGMKPLGYHITNVALHSLNAFVLFLILKKLAVPGAFLASLVFALHPVNLESVAWISERKNVLSVLFVLLATLSWLGFERNRARWQYLASLFLFVLGLFSKTTICILPMVFILISWWKGSFGWRRLIGLTLPFFVVGLVLGGLTIWIERTESYALGPEFEIPMSARIAIAGKAVWFYLGKILFPFELMTIYPKWEFSDRLGWEHLFPVTVLLVLVSLWLARRRIGKAGFVVSSYFVLALLPTLGFVNFAFMRFSFVADHFQYLAAIGPICGFSALVSSLFLAKDCPYRRVAMPMCIVVLAGLGAMTWQLGWSYKDSETLWRHNLEKNPDGITPRDYYGNELLLNGKAEEAYQVYSKGIEIHPDSATFHFGLSRSLAKKGAEDLAMEHLRETVRLSPNHSTAHQNLALVYSARGDDASAVHHFEQGIRANPFPERLSEIYNAYGLHLAQQDRQEQALRIFEKGLEVYPDLVPLHFNLGLLQRDLQHFEDALEHLSQALHLSPDSTTRIAPQIAATHHHYALVLEEKGQTEKALFHLSEAIRIWPRYLPARKDLRRISEREE